ncbi:hypothetical protein TNCV_4527121 [Trichonephila clavipes]|nr:hypothetical protein TNCV_4527121 [Trichonephila clavipes]
MSSNITRSRQEGTKHRTKTTNTQRAAAGYMLKAKNRKAGFPVISVFLHSGKLHDLGAVWMNVVPKFPVSARKTTVFLSDVNSAYVAAEFPPMFFIIFRFSVKINLFFHTNDEAQTSSRWCGVEDRRGGASSDVVLVT